MASKARLTSIGLGAQLEPLGRPQQPASISPKDEPFFSTTRWGESFVAAMQTLEGTAADAALRAQQQLTGCLAAASKPGAPRDALAITLRGLGFVYASMGQLSWLKMPSALLEGSALSALLVAQRVRMLLLCPTRLLSLKLDMTSAPRPGVPPR